jgi:predicted nucleic acid-binding protein
MIALDASTAILLAKAELLEAFIEDVDQTVAMPKDVQEECRGRDSLDARLIDRAIEEERIEVKAVDRRAVPQLVRDFGLGVGEAAAIALAAPERALVATDDRRAIHACKVLKIPFTTTISVLTRTREKGLLSREQALEKLNRLARDGRYKKEIIAAARADMEK